MDERSNAEELLLPEDAAHFLGISPELLFAYVKNAPKTCLGDDRHLATVQVNGRTMFSRTELAAFDSYLSEPWSHRGEPRPSIPTYISDYLKVECGGQCARCGKGFKLENAHIDDYSRSFSHHHRNLIRLCSHCHDEFDSKRIILRAEMVALKRQLIESNRQRITNRNPLWQNVITPAPSPSSLFVGRDKDLDAFTKVLKSSRSVCVQGIAGIGKTQFVLQCLARQQSERPVLWVNIESIRTVSELELFLKAAVLATIQGSPTANLAQLLDAMGPYVIFDGVEAMTSTDLYKLEDFFSQLLNHTKVTTFVFTSQPELVNVHLDARFLLEPLDVSSSLELLVRFTNAQPTKASDDEDAMTWLIHFCDGHPLTLSVVAGLLLFFKSAVVVAERIQRMGLMSLQSSTRAEQTKQTSLTSCLAVAYSALNAEEQHVLFLVSHCPSGLPVGLIDSEKHDLKDPQMAVAGLRRWHLLTLEIDGGLEKLYVLSPVRLFVQNTFEHEKHNTADQTILGLVTSLTIWALVLDQTYIQEGHAGVGIARFWQEFPNFMHAFDEAVSRSERNAGFSALVYQLASALQVFCFVAGFWWRGINMMRLGANAAISSGNVRTASRLLLHLTVLARRVNDRDLVTKTADELTAMAGHTSDPVVAGNAAMGQGEIAQESGRLNEAKTHYEAAAALYNTSQHGNETAVDGEASDTQADNRDERMLGLALFELGRMCERAIEYENALNAYKRSCDSMIHSHDQINIGSVQHHIGNCNANLGYHEEALAAYLNAAARFYEIGAAGHLSNSLSELGYLLIDYEPSETLDEVLSDSLIVSGLSDALLEAAQRFNVDVFPFPAERCLQTVRKVFGVAALATFTSQSAMLQGWAAALREGVVRPLAVQLEQGIRDKDIVIMHLDLTTTLIGSIPEKEGSGLDTATLSLATIEHLARLCYLQYDWAWKALRLFDWLAAYLLRGYGIKGVSAEALKNAACAAEEKGVPFSLSGFNNEGPLGEHVL